MAFVWGSGGSRSENAAGSLPQWQLPDDDICYYFFLGVFAFSVLTFCFAVFPGGRTRIRNFLSWPMVLSVLFLVVRARRQPQMHRLAKSGGGRPW